MSPDIAMCRGEDFDGNVCPKKDKCYRHIAKESYHQSYMIIENVKKCGHYWPCPSKGMKKRLDIMNGE